MSRLFLLLCLLTSVIGCSSSDTGSADSKQAAGKSAASNGKSKGGFSLKLDAQKLKTKSRSAIENFQSKIRFTEVQQKSGLDFRYENGQQGQSLMVETTGGGSGWLDFDLDGNWDAYLVQGGDPTKESIPSQPADQLFRQTDSKSFSPVTDPAGIVERGYSQGVAIGDFDGDGFDDIYVTNTGPNALFRNMGDGSFVEMTIAAGVGDGDRWSSTAAWADIDLDGDLDLYVCNYTQYDRFHPHPCVDAKGNPAICHPKHVDAWPDACYINNGDGTFTDESQERGLFGEGNKGLGVAVADYNRDGFPDLYIANDTTANFLFINDGTGKFNEVARTQGCAVDRAGAFQASMGLGIYDYDGNGFLDIYSTHYTEESNTLYRNMGPTGFRDETANVNLHTPTRPWLGFGTIMGDFDRDSLADVFIAHGHVNNTPAYLGKQKMEAGLFCYDGAKFHEARQTAGDYFKRKFIGRGVSSCDYDNDGDLDLLVSHQNDKASLLQNDSQSGHYLKIRLIGIQSNRVGMGAKISVTTANGKTYYNELVAGTTYVSSNQPILIFGLGEYDGNCDVKIEWPSGITDLLKDVAVDQSLTLIESKP